jgi:imidazolonepropionase-like amidohydrolase
MHWLLLAQLVTLTHVEIIDGTGAAPRADQNITIDGGKIVAISPGRDVLASNGATVLDLHGHAVMPGIVGMHDHLIYLANTPGDGPSVFHEMPYSAPRLYLANGVTTLRTTASVDTYLELRVARSIDAGTTPGPHVVVTSPFLDDSGAAKLAEFWADRGVTSFKAYQHITREALKAVVQIAHRRGGKVTGHLCSVTYDEAIDAGIDNLEHGFQVNTALDPDKKPDICTASRGDSTLMRMAPGSAEANRLIASLVSHHVAITSTLVGLSESTDRQRFVRPALLDALSPSAQDAYLLWRNRPNASDTLLKRDMALQRAFLAAGGLLIAGPDPVGFGYNIPGFGDQRQLELLVDAGFTPVQAIKIATLNGAIFLGRDAQIGSIAPGKNADLLIVKGDPATHIADIEKVEIVFKDGVRYDPAALLAQAKGKYGLY